MRHFSRLGLVALSALAAAPLTADSYFVTTTNDSGAGSLRQAILDANAHPGFDQITFSIGGAGVHTITPATPLSDITDGIEILGFTQPGSSANSNGPGLPDNSVHLIAIDGTNSGGGTGAAVLRFNNPAGGFIVDGLVIHSAPAPRSRSTAPRAAPSGATSSVPTRRDRPRTPTITESRSKDPRMSRSAARSRHSAT